MLKIARECFRTGGRGPQLWQMTVSSKKLHNKENYKFILFDKHY